MVNGRVLVDVRSFGVRTPLLGYALQQLIVEGQRIPLSMLQVEQSTHVGPEAYDAGAKVLQAFFDKNLADFQCEDLDPAGREIIQCCLDGGTVEDYQRLLKGEPIFAFDD